jgi:NAD(P)-dependent dehydrogenase (short-subunit alcohol dehydrogenase family)
MAENRRFDALTEAEDVVKDIDLSGKLAVITGASAGLGAETARVLAKAGADLVIGARRTSQLQELADRLSADYGVSVSNFPLDLADAGSVDAFADSVLALDRPIDIFVENAGITLNEKRVDARGNELQFSVNFLSHALLLSRLAPALKRAGKSRFVCLTSRGHQNGPVDFEDPNFEQRSYDWLMAYRQSKSAIALMAVKAQNALGRYGVTCFSVHPGVIKTELQQIVPNHLQQAAGRKPTTTGEYKSVGQGAATTVWAAVDPGLERFGGHYLEDCGVAEEITAPNRSHGVMPHARDPELSEKVWSLAEKLIGRPLPL